MKKQLANLIVRALTLAGKFVLIFFLAKFVTPEEVGLYGLVTVTVGYFTFLVGLDFYTFSTRELLKVPKSHWGALLKNQLSFTGIMYAIVLPLGLIVFLTKLLPWQMAIWFYLLLVVEHVSQEVNRFLVAVGEPIAATTVMFLRSGLWCPIIITAMYYMPKTRNLHAVFLAWTVSGTIAILIGLWRMKNMQTGDWCKAINWRWIKKGIVVAVPLLVGTLAIRGVFTIDRYWFRALNSMELLGAYVLYAGICNAYMSFLDSGVFMFSYPELIMAHNQKNERKFKREMQKLSLQTVVVSFIFAISAYFVLPILIDKLGRPIYEEHQILFWWLLAANVLMGLGMVPHYGLYARGTDKPLVQSQLIGLIVFLLTTFGFSFISHYYAIPVALVVTFAVILLIKSVWSLQKEKIIRSQ